MKRFALVLTGLGLIAGCTGSVIGPGTGNEPTGKTKDALAATLQPMANCAEVEQFVRAQALANMNKAIDDAIASYGKGNSGMCYSYGAAASAPGGTAAPSAANGPVDDSSGSKGASSVSGTNNQVAGVDEADFIKNDTKYIYAVANGALRIVDAFPAEQAHLVSKTPIEGQVRKLFVEGNRALVYTAIPSVLPQPSSSQGPSYGPSGPTGAKECTYGYDCEMGADGTSTKILVFDLTDRANPQKLREITASGSLIAARRIGNAVHTVIADGQAVFPNVQTYPQGVDLCASNPSNAQKLAAVMAFEDLRKKNAALIASAPMTGHLPTVSEGSSNALAACSGFYRSRMTDGSSFTSLVSMDMAQDGALHTATVLSKAGTVYASDEALYISLSHQRVDGEAWFDSMPAEKQASTVHKFRLGETPDLTAYLASGMVKGRVLNQFSMDEYQRNLRMATTSGHVPDPNVYSTLTVFEQQGTALVPVGSVDNIAPNEDIRSVRFDGQRGYVVTFKKTDPLFVFDLANPAQPKELAELKIPGFSAYMHMMDSSHLLTIGYDADDQGSFAWFKGIMLQIFDVSNPTDPQLTFKEYIGTRGSSSEALADHLAFNYFAPKNLLALPMTVCEGGGNGGSYGTTMTFSGLMVYDVTATGGFHLRGKVSHPNAPNASYDNSLCGTWWANATSTVKRSVIMDDYIYSVAEDIIRAQSLSSLGSDLASVPLDK